MTVAAAPGLISCLPQEASLGTGVAPVWSMLIGTEMPPVPSVVIPMLGYRFGRCCKSLVAH